MLRWLGLSKETRVHITAPGIDVVLAGEPRRVRQLLDIITHALESTPQPLSRDQQRAPLPASQIVEPSELDETDSPYALPGAEPMVRPAVNDATYEIPGRNAARRRERPSSAARPPPRAPSLALEDRSSERPTRLPTPDAELAGTSTDLDPPLERTPVEDEPDSERTAVAMHPRVPGLRSAEVEVTDTRAPTAEPPSGATVEAPRVRSRRRGSS